jgi:hypothetical protein
LNISLFSPLVFSFFVKCVGLTLEGCSKLTGQVFSRASPAFWLATPFGSKNGKLRVDPYLHSLIDGCKLIVL